MSNDTKMNSTHQTEKSKEEILSMDECVSRLRMYYGESSVPSIMRRLQIPPSTYGNWRKRNSVTYEHLVRGLIREGISLDWFFAPEQRLNYPSREQLHVADVESAKYASNCPDNNARVLAALAEIRKVLQQYGLPETQFNQELMLTLCLAERAGQVPTRLALEQVAATIRAVNDDPLAD